MTVNSTHVAVTVKGPVPLEYSIGCVTCTVVNMMDAVMVGLPGYAQDRLPPDVPVCSAGLSWCSAATGRKMPSCSCSGIRTRCCAWMPCRVLYEPGDRVWFAAVARLLPRRRWTEVFPVTPATLPAWHRKPAGSKYDTSKRRKPGRPPTIPSVGRLVVRLAKRESAVGTPPHPRRTDEARREDRAVHRVGDPACCGHRSGASPLRPTWRQFLNARAAGIPRGLPRRPDLPRHVHRRSGRDPCRTCPACR